MKRLPETLGAALDALETNPALIAGFSESFVQYFVALRRNELEYMNKLSADEERELTSIRFWCRHSSEFHLIGYTYLLNPPGFNMRENSFWSDQHNFWSDWQFII